jgi:uncharacterized membrane protein
MMLGSTSATMWILMVVQWVTPLVIIGLLVALVVGHNRKRSEDQALAAALAAERAAERAGGGPRPAQTVEERLAEIERLFTTGAISQAERDAARARLLRTL